MLNAIWYGKLFTQQLVIDIAMQMSEHTMEFCKSKIIKKLLQTLTKRWLIIATQKLKGKFLRDTK
jgi:hypothetical protein